MIKSSNYKFFLLTEDCLLVKGERKGAIYNIESGEVFSLGDAETLIIENCENEKSIDEISKILRYKASTIRKFLKKIEQYQLGFFYDKPVYIDKYRFLELHEKEALPEPIVLDTLILELHKRCNLDCIFCKNMKYTFCGCRKNSHSAFLGKEIVKRAIKEAKNFDLKSILFIGGDPFLLGKNIAEVLHFSKKFVSNVVIHSNATNMEDYLIDLVSELKIHLLIPVYTHEEVIFDRIVGIKNSFRNLLNSLNKLLNKEASVNIIIYISKYLKKYDETAEFFNKLGCRIIAKRFIYPKDTNNIRFLKLYNRQKRSFSRINKDIFLYNKKYNVCLNKKVAITCEGNIVPCHIAEHEIVGNIKTDSLNNIIRSGALNFYWEATKEKCEICNKCEYRFLCVDCLINEHTIENRKLTKNKYCRYNPLIGKWEI